MICRLVASRWNWIGLEKVRFIGMAERRTWIEGNDNCFSMRRQWHLITRSGLH